MKKTTSFLLLLAVLLLSFTPKTFAENQPESARFRINTDSFGNIAIQDEGRIKPLNTYARTFLLQISGKRSYQGKPAIDWFAKLLFTPGETDNDKVFLINSPEIPRTIGLEPDAHRRYSFAQISPGIEKLRQLAIKADAIDAKERSLVEQEILRVYGALMVYSKIRNAFTFTLALDEFNIREDSVSTILDFPVSQKNFSFLDLALKADLINEETKALEKKKSESWSSDEKEFMRLLRNLYQFSLNAPGDGPAIVPSMDQKNETWLSAWEQAKHGFSSEKIRKELWLIQNMADAYAAEDQLAFDLAVKNFTSDIKGRVNTSQSNAYKKIPLEIFYNKSNLFLFAWFFYLLTFFVFLFALIWPQKVLHTIGLICLVLGFIPHLSALILRMVIMSRPPVTNLYETFIFVGVVTVLLSLVTEIFNKKWLGTVVGSISGFVFLAIADKFSAEGDTMRMLVAVLNSNFWLSTHVLSITIGYAGCCVAGIMGHVYILQALFKPKDKATLNNTYRYIWGIMGFGLTMAFLGTMLGGIWADQSWGRFWGWDPKENGALLIVLWTAIVFHAKAGRMIQPLGFAIGAALCLIIVMWAWFGVNLLSIGLHSYGFTSGIAQNLGIYVICEIIFLSVSTIYLGIKGIPV